MSSILDAVNKDPERTSGSGFGPLPDGFEGPPTGGGPSPNRNRFLAVVAVVVGGFALGAVAASLLGNESDLDEGAVQVAAVSEPAVEPVGDAVPPREAAQDKKKSANKPHLNKRRPKGDPVPPEGMKAAKAQAKGKLKVKQLPEPIPAKPEQAPPLHINAAPKPAPQPAQPTPAATPAPVIPSLPVPSTPTPTPTPKAAPARVIEAIPAPDEMKPSEPEAPVVKPTIKRPPIVIGEPSTEKKLDLAAPPKPTAQPFATPPVAKPVAPQPLQPMVKPVPLAVPPAALPVRDRLAVLTEAPAGAPEIQLLFVMWARDAGKRMVSMRIGDGGVQIAHEGDVVGHQLNVASIHRDAIDVTWTGRTFRVDVPRF
ncbi:MAG: hypothetical protein ACI8TX_003590 [Hyphomicrobiaceae bacterium]|jgi:hypothetical protein